ncbi:Cobalamin synthase [Candidatus Rhodobacter oscarellae]|uniref:Adenosylcobinamide-GDP ribazoletransferase n=1 Tax=Candidatus Rhodobacter oscarellae TaxID=1675527 RepID=A0A0J9E5P9_9RHOB|nr:adenosylcobinamide-GDP ribazoletransferase [Candidatus Rhodobacter lobularis]KMW58062.1 Cobalamin synthase [Candidatus Rhodobacter lobularis]
MPDRDTQLLRPNDIAEAVGLLTRLPVRLRGVPRGAAAAWAYPVAGLLVAAIGASVAWLAGGLPPAMTAGLALAAMVIVTGALHEDGLADTADGLWGGWTRDRRLEIMRDSRIGAYGVLALVFGVGLRWAALAAIAGAGPLWPALLAAGALSRAPMVAVMYALPNARGDGLAAATGRPGGATLWVAIFVGLGLAGLAIGWAVLPAALACGAISAALALVARAKIGGQTGDILGATQQTSEIAILAVLAAATV